MKILLKEMFIIKVTIIVFFFNKTCYQPINVDIELNYAISVYYFTAYRYFFMKY